RGRVVGQHLDLGDHIHFHGGEHAAVGSGVDVGNTIDRQIIGIVPIPVDRSAYAAILHHAWNRPGQLQEVARQEREVDDLSRVEHAGALRALGLERYSLSFDEYGFTDAADFKLEAPEVDAVVGEDLDVLVLV